MKRFLMTFAAMLLMSVGAFAQSENTPIKGDVNGDGVVDVADIASVISIMKNGGGTNEGQYTWYQGTATEELIDTYNGGSNFDPNKVAILQSYINGLSYNQETKPANDSSISLLAGYNVIMVPSSWGQPTIGSDITYAKTYTPYTVSDLGISNPSGKLVFVYESGAATTAYIKWPVEETTVYYFGTTKPTASNYTSLTPSYTTSGAVYGKTAYVDSNSYIYYLCPSSNALTDAQRKAAMLDSGGNIVKFSTTIDTTTISGYTIYQQLIDNASTMKFNVNY